MEAQMQGKERPSSGPPCPDMTSEREDSRPASDLLPRPPSSSSMNYSQIDSMSIAEGDARSTDFEDCQPGPMSSQESQHEPASKQDWPQTPEDRPLRSAYFDQETAFGQPSPVPTSRWSSSSTYSQDVGDAGEDQFLSVSPTKSLRQGPKAHRRAATIPAMFAPKVKSPEIVEHDTIEHGPQHHIRSEFKIVLKVCERIDFESLPNETARLSLRGMRNSFRGRMGAIASRLSTGYQASVKT